RPRPAKTTSAPPPPQQLPTLRDQWSSSWLPLSGAAIVAGLMGFYVLGTLTASLKSTTTPCCSHDHADETPTGRPLAMTADNAEQFDKELNFPECPQTFGLCSVSDPVAVVSNLATAVKPGTGRIILLEHGKGWYGIVNGLLDRNAGQHFEKYGCWWNRDIQALVEEAARKTPGLEVVKVERPFLLQMGTLLWIELKMNPTPQ
ncbi:unnamed protein product, partial [Clonostachys rosea f. rosea IK726]